MSGSMLTTPTSPPYVGKQLTARKTLMGSYMEDIAKACNCQNWKVATYTEMGACWEIWLYGQGPATKESFEFVQMFSLCNIVLVPFVN